MRMPFELQNENVLQILLSDLIGPLFSPACKYHVNIIPA